MQTTRPCMPKEGPDHAVPVMVLAFNAKLKIDATLYKLATSTWQTHFIDLLPGMNCSTMHARLQSIIL